MEPEQATHWGQCVACNTPLFGVPTRKPNTLLVPAAYDPWATTQNPNTCAHAQVGNIACAVAEVRDLTPIPPEPELGRRRCPEGDGVVKVVEIDDRCSTYRGRHEYEWTATRLVCGHTIEGPERIVGASPGGEAAAEAMAGARTQARLARSAAAQELPW